MNFIDAFKAYFFKWNDFRGRSSRSEYWWATLLVSLASLPAGFIVGAFIGFMLAIAGFSETTMEVVLGIAILPLQIFMTIASTCLIIRRLHDVDRSGWWYLLIFTLKKT